VSNWMSATSLEVAPSGECLRSEGLVWLIGVVVLAAAVGGSNCPLARAMDGRIALQHHWLLPINCHFRDCTAYHCGLPCK